MSIRMHTRARLLVGTTPWSDLWGPLGDSAYLGVDHGPVSMGHDPVSLVCFVCLVLHGLWSVTRPHALWHGPVLVFWFVVLVLGCSLEGRYGVSTLLSCIYVCFYC
ncbi:hypothetical protein HanRHA438_Chr08g0339401 [Helianthus annuus]|nr:hypothetical protein HanRHA438_Chr08g0339401 [Helianthus annuus]